MAIRVPAQFPRGGKVRLAFVGEAPSNEELRIGQPLVGADGRIFNQLLRTANIERDTCLITNVFDMKLPDNEVAHWCAPMDVARKEGFADLPPVGKVGYLKPEHRHHLERLQTEIERASPDVIVPLGPTALWAFTGYSNIGGYRGNIVEAKYLVPGAKLLPTFHPSFVRQTWKYFTVVSGDFEKAMSESHLHGSRIVLPHRELWLEPTLADLEAFTPFIMSSDLLSVDIETGWGMITCIGFAPSAERAIVVPLVDLRQPNKSYWATPAEELEAMGHIRAWLDNPIPKVGQNFGGYDFLWLLQKYGLRPRNMAEDTRLMHHARYAELDKSLEFMGASYTAQGAWKQMGRRTEKRDD